MSEPHRSPHPSPGRRSLPDRRARERRVLFFGLLISVAVHALILAVVGDWLEPDPTRATRPAEPLIAEPPRGMRAIQLSEPPPQPVRTEPEEPEDGDEEPETAAPVVAQAEAPDDAPADTLSAADRLAVRVVDPRLWRPMILMPREPDIDDVEARIAAAVELLSDSALAEAEAAIRARDWTVEDGSGGRWGISPGKLHLGSLTLPLPIFFPVDPEVRDAQQQWWELDQQFERARILESFRERVQAIRERRDRERREAREGDNGGG